jgi:hypothetical protein
VLVPEEVPEPDGAPTIAAVIPETVPVKVGELSGAKAVERKALEPNIPPVPIFKVEASVPEKVREFETTNVFPDVTESPVTVPALPIVFWLKVGKLVKEAALPFGAKKTVPAPVV